MTNAIRMCTRLLRAAALGAAAHLLLPAMAGAKGWGLPENISTFGGEIDHMFWLIFWITTVTFFITMGVLVYSVARFRYKAGEKAHFIHGSHRLELAWTLVPAAILLFLALYQTKTWAKIKMDIPAGDPSTINLQVFAKQFEWNFRHPGTDGVFDTDDDICSINELVIPVNRNAVVSMRSLDVIHSLFLPYLRFKQDVMPGMTVRGWFNVMKTTAQGREERGDDGFNYEIACTELCGLGHHEMRGRLTVLSETEFDTWVAEKSAQAVQFSKPEIWDSWDKAGGEIELPELHGADHEEAGADEEWDDEWDE